MTGRDPPSGSRRRAARTPLEERVALLLHVAALHGHGLSLRELWELLPSEGPEDVASLRSWIGQRPALARLAGDEALDPDLAAPRAGSGEGESREMASWSRSLDEVPTLLRPVSGLLRTVAVTGSVAYGAPGPSDDLDLMVVVREGSLWTFLTYAFLALRLQGRAGRPEWCLNYVVDDRRARSLAERSQGLLIARELLAARPILGGPYFRALVESSLWLREQLPRRFTGASPTVALPSSSKAPLPIRLLDRALFPLVSAYLQSRALVRNHRYRRAGLEESIFRLTCEPGRLQLRSRKFDRLRTLYGTGATAPTGRAVPSPAAPARSVRLPPEVPPVRVARVSVLAGGIVAFNEERNIEGAIGSLLEQPLPEGLRWGSLWVVVSGSTDGTASRVRRVAERDPRVRLVVQAEREGKSSAINEVLSRAEGDLLVLMNADAQASPGALKELLRAARGLPRPFGVMARPVPRSRATGAYARGIRMVWEVHHQVHCRLFQAGRGTHFSEELLLFSLPGPRPLPPAINADGSFLASDLLAQGGRAAYAPAALVRIEVPAHLGDYFRQRRRIRWGHAQAKALIAARAPSVWGLARRDPALPIRVLFGAARREKVPIPVLFAFATVELAARAAAAWDRQFPRRDHILWEMIPEAPTEARERLRTTGAN